MMACRMPYQGRRGALCRHRRGTEDLPVLDPPFGRRMVRMGGTSGVSQLVRASASGDQAAWNELVRRYARLVMAVIRSYRLTTADAQDVSQTVWLRLVEHLGSLREPEALPR